MNNLFHDIPSPCYVMEEAKLRNNLKLISNVAAEADVEIILAFKAFALWKSFPIFREYISATTASSPYEALLSLKEFGSRAHTYSPAYTANDFRTILDCSSHITFNSISQFEQFYPFVLEYNQKLKQTDITPITCGIRVNPEYSEIETELYNPCAPGSRFGILADQLPEHLPDGIKGFHCHNHCESDSYALERSLQHLENKFGHWMDQIEWLNLGGGHLMTRKNYDVKHLVNVLNNLHKRHPNLHIIMEPGSAFAWQTGFLIADIVDIVENHGIKTAIVNVSFTCHMPDCLEMPYTPVIREAQIISSETASTLETDHVYRIGGNSCLSGDVMGSWKFDHILEIGEQLIFEDMIHYTTVKTNMFNGISHPAIGLLKNDGTFECYRQFTYEDYRNRMC